MYSYVCYFEFKVFFIPLLTLEGLLKVCRYVRSLPFQGTGMGMGMGMNIGISIGIG
jgi:hypothetical protein